MQPTAFDQTLAFLKQHGFNVDGIIATLMGALIAAGLLPKLTFRQAILVLACGVATNVYIVPLAFWAVGLSADSPLARTAAFLSGLLGMRVIIVFASSAESARSPRDFLNMFLQGSTTPPAPVAPQPPKDIG